VTIYWISIYSFHYIEYNLVLRGEILMTTQIAWTPIPIEKIDDICDGNYPAKRKERDLARLFHEHGLDITKPHEKLNKPGDEVWKFRPDSSGELITVDALQP
jgi:hypothetical protein